jgi:hypothetical protein
MKIAIFHNEDIHFEVLGYLIDYLQTCDIEFHIYSGFSIGTYIGETYSRWYNNFFQKQIIWKTNNILESNINYDVVFLVTDDNPMYNSIKDKYLNKTISIDHWLNSRNECKVQIGTRKFYSRPELPYAMQCYNIISKEDKFELLRTKDRIQVVFVGRFNVPNSFTFSFFNNFENIDFHLIIWDMNPYYIEFLKHIPNFYVHCQMETEDMMNLMKNSHYVFFNPSYIEGYAKHKTSATLQLAISTLVKVIIPKSWNDNYQFDQRFIVEYDDLDYLRPNKQINLTLEDYFRSLDLLSNERRNHIAHRNIIFEQAIEEIVGFNHPRLKSSWLTKAFSRLCLTSFPKVFVGIESCFENNIINDFREVHIINSISTEIIKNHRAYNYTDNSTTSILETVCGSILEPSVFLIEENVMGGQEYYSKVFNTLSTRETNDIIIINFIINLNSIQTTKKYSIYHFENEPFIILIPKYENITNEIFQIFLGKNYNKIPTYVIDKIKEESIGYNYTLYNGYTSNILLEDANDIIKNKYNSCLRYQHKKDILEMILLYNRGGIYVDIDCQPLTSFENIIKRSELKPTFVGVLSINRNDGLTVSLMACTKFNKIISIILNELNSFNFENYVNNDYALICRMVGIILQKFIGVEELTPGFYEIKDERILILNEIWDGHNYTSAQVLYNDELVANSKYVDYPWNLDN